MKIAVTALFAILYFGFRLSAQDADTVLLKNDDRKFTLVSQIEDPKEASAFLSILQAKQPSDRLAQAQSFIKTYPQSWLLAQTYDLSARSAIDVGDYEAAISAGRLSLRMSRENPSLLILMANIEAQQKQFSHAVNYASDAIEYLNQIERPPNMSQSEWKTVRPQLESSAYFARARAKAAQGMDPASSPNLLVAALKDLNYSAAWNPNDAEVFYLRALVESKLGQNNAAASDLSFVVQGNSDFLEKAKHILLILSRRTSTPFDAFLKTLPPRTIDESLLRQPQQTTYDKALTYGYAGPEACRRCHENEYAAWRKTGMARMLQPYRRENVIADFSSTFDPALIRLGVEGRPYFELRNLGQWTRYYVDFTIGSKWQQAYATKLPDGRLQVLPIEYNVLQKKWINYWRMIDPPDSARANIQDFTKLSSATNYQQNCAICHTSQLKADVTSPDPMQHGTYLQPGIDCEMCHGPSAWHIRQTTKGTVEHPDPAEPPLDFRKVNNREGVRVCAQCHRQSSVREIGDGGEMIYSVKTAFVPTTWLRPYDAFSRKAFFKDGRFRETTFIVEAFTRSACYLRGTAQCASCHSPHLSDFDNNKTSLKFQNSPNEMCLGCHSQFRNRIAEHTRHSVGSQAAQCVTCHMPRIMNGLLFKARSHQIEIPTADLTERFGQNDSPNVCLTCHEQKDPAWAKEKLTAWAR